MDQLIQPIKDKDVLRIKNKIEILNNLFRQGAINIIINIFLSWTTLEISNGVEKLSIQDIIMEFKQRLDELNKLFEEVCICIEMTDDARKIEKEKSVFREKVYKLFNLTDLFKVLVKKCIGKGFNMLVPFLNMDKLTVLMVDTILLVDTESEFESKIMEYLDERVSAIPDGVDRKMTKLKILQSLVEKVVKEKVQDSDLVDVDLDSVGTEMSDRN